MSRKSLFLLSLAAAIVLIIAYRWTRLDFDWSLFFSGLRNLQPGWLALSVAVSLSTYVIRAFRWQVLLSPVKPIRAGLLISTNIVGFSAIYVLGRAGELIRPLWLTRREQIPWTASVATVIVERFLDTVMLIVLFGWALLLVELPAVSAGGMALVWVGVGVVVGGSPGAVAVLFFFRSNIERILRFVPFARLASLLRNFSMGLSFLERGRSFGLALAHSATLWVAIALQFWFMLLGMDFQFSMPASTLVLVGTAIGSIAQVPGIGGGFQAGYVFCMMTFFAVPAEQAIATSLVAWIASCAPTIVVAGFYMIAHGLSLKDLRTATAE